MKIISRKEAKAKGLKRYYTGKACKYGHVDERSVATHRCVQCALVESRSNYYANREYWRKWGEKRTTERRRRRFLNTPPELRSYAMTRKQAKNGGLSHYFNGKACTHGHLALRRVRDGRCVKCEQTIGRQRDREYKRRYRDVLKRRYRQYRVEHRTEIGKRRREQRAKYRKELSDSYVKRLLTERCSLGARDIPPQVVDLKRLHLQAIRELRKRGEK